MSYPPHPSSPYSSGGYGPPLEHPSGTTVLVLGILSLVLCGVIGPFAWVMGNRVLREIDSSGLPYANRSNVNAGRICGIISTCFLLAAIALYALLAVLLGALWFAVALSL